MKAVVTVIGKDNVGILHKVSGICAEYKANVIEVTQSVLQDMFAMFLTMHIKNSSLMKFLKYSRKNSLMLKSRMNSKKFIMYRKMAV